MRVIMDRTNHITCGGFMGAAFFIVLEQTVEGVDTDMDGKALARNIDALDEAARALGVRPLSEFVSMDSEAASDFELDDDAEVDAGDLPPIAFFDAATGLATVRALAGHPVSQLKHVATDLARCEHILGAALERSVRWNLHVDL
jgi:hypothetical protein